MTRLQTNKEPKWSLEPVDDRPAEGNYPVELRREERGKVTSYGRIDDPEVSGDKLYSWDYGIVIRSPHPKPQLEDRLVTVMAGPRSVGSGAACLAATRSPLIRKIQDKLPRGFNIADKREAFWVLVKGTITDKTELLDVDGVEIVEAGVFHDVAR